MLHPKNEASLLAYVASALGQILTLLNHASDTVSGTIRPQLLRIVQALPLEPALAAQSWMPLVDPPANEKQWSDLQRLQLRNFQELRARFAQQYGEDFASQVFDGKDAPPDPTSAELSGELASTKAENAELKKMLQQLSDRMSLLEQQKTPGAAAPAAPAAPTPKPADEQPKS